VKTSGFAPGARKHTVTFGHTAFFLLEERDFHDRIHKSPPQALTWGYEINPRNSLMQSVSKMHCFSALK
jgi:hypothetical protein